ncbi:fatty acid desaturase 6 [Corythoichthys intestinalis]|uniref:fatty acid desaturase 6 n=1 Tax=Corythoichthys intestinalis TaxID=161448 RepID=UPI0025A605AE|nr:fatty acid desaturase 6 [Corythoichthys intestinalis]
MGDDRGMTTIARSREDEEESMKELKRKVEAVLKASSWWERTGLDCATLAAAFAICLPAGLLLLRSSDWPRWLCGLLLMGVVHAIVTVKGAHLSSHGALGHSLAAKRFWAIFFIEVCSSFSARAAQRAHINLHHPHTNVIGLGDSSTWKLPRLPRLVYLFLAPLTLPIVTPVAALAQLGDTSAALLLRTLALILLGVASHFWLLMAVSGFQSPLGAALCMLATRSMFSLPFVHVNIFQHIGLPMFGENGRPARLLQMSHGVLNLPRNILLDWTFGHSLISCHVEHHLFPFLSDNMCLKVKPLVSRYLADHNLPYQEDGYLSRLGLFFHKYQELMVAAPPITRLAGIQ